jgi:hypothetical protein
MDAGSHLSNFGNLPKLPLPPTPSTPGLQGIQRTRETTAPGQKELIPSGLAAMAEVMQTPPKIQVTIDDTKQVFQKQLMKPEARTQAKIDTLGTLNSFSNEASALKKRTISSPAVEATAATLHKQKINADILKVQASQLVHDAANGITVKPEVYLKVANSLESVQIHEPTITTLMLQLYEKAALKFTEQGDIPKAFEARGKAANAIEFSPNNVLNNMTAAIATGIAKQALPDTGLHIKSGSSRAPDGIVLRTRPNLDGTTKDVVNFALAPSARKELTEKMKDICTVKSIAGKPEVVLSDNFAAFQQSLPANLGPVTITMKKSEYQGKDDTGKFTANQDHAIKFNTYVYEIGFANGGKVTFGLDPKFQLMYKGVQVEVPSNLPKGEGIKQMQQMMTVLGIGPVMGGQRMEDDQRLLNGLMLRSHFPQAFDTLEKDPSFYDLSPADLKAKILQLEPGMKKVFKNYDENPGLIGIVEIFPGKNMYSLADIPAKMTKAGMMGFMSGVGCNRTDSTGKAYVDFGAVLSILNCGPLSTEERLYSATNLRGGASIESDVQTAEGVFLRGVNKAVSKLEINKDTIKFSGEVQVLYDTAVMGVGGVCYFGDQFGLRNENYGKQNESAVYKNRLNAENFTKGLGVETDKFPLRATLPDDCNVNDKGVMIDQNTKKPVKDPLGGGFNEVCIDGGNINPSFIKGLVVQSEEVKQGLLTALESKGMLKYADRNAAGQIIKGTIVYRQSNGQNAIMVPVNNFIHVGSKFQEKMWSDVPRK